MSEKLHFTSDYMEGACPQVLQRLAETNMEHTQGYGFDEYCESARKKIRNACSAPEADIFFMAGGTQTNMTVIDSLLRRYEGVIAASTGHVAVHEAGAIEFTGHKVLTIPMHEGKIAANDLEDYLYYFDKDENREHMVQPGMVYLSQPTEYGTIYTLNELEAIHEVCHKHSLPLYVDGARLAYALACDENDVGLDDLARLADVFYIGGTKCGALFGEAVVIPKHGYIPHFFTSIKEHGALLAKGRMLGIQFDTLFTDNLYYKAGLNGTLRADGIRLALSTFGYKMYMPNPTNQIFIEISDELYEKLSEKVEFGFMEKPDKDHSIVRIATSWATTEEDARKLVEILADAALPKEE